MPKKPSREEAITYLKGIDNRLHYIQTCDDGVYAGCIRDAYHDEQKMDVKEIKKILKVVRDYELPMVPICTNWGFDVGFTIYDSDNKGMVPDAGKKVLTFIEKQLPNGYDFKKLSKVFLSDKNTGLLRYFGLDKRHDIEKMNKKSTLTY